MDFKDLNKKKISLVKCYWKVKKAVSTISFRLCFLLFWVSKVNQRNRAESWDYWEWLQLGFQNLPTYFKGKQENNKLYTIHTPAFLTLNWLCREGEKWNTKGVLAKNKCRNNEECLNARKAVTPFSSEPRVLSSRAATCSSWGCIFLLGSTSLPGQA